jgi:serine/threonine-protein kinase
MRVSSRYELHDQLGTGGMGTVYRATDTRTEQTVAVKLLKPEVIDNDRHMLERFAREAEALRQLNHPNIVKMLDMQEENGAYYLVMEYVAGGDLNTLLKHERLPVERVLRLAIDLADALTRAHKLNIIHRDLKPANVLVADDGTLRLTDFGVAHFGAKERVTGTGVAVGTMDYLAPEALIEAEVDARADIWAFGVMLFEMLAGKRPFEGSFTGQVLMAIVSQPVPDLEALCPNAPTALVDLVYRMLEKDRNQRIPSVRLVGAELEAILQGRDTTAIRAGKKWIVHLPLLRQVCFWQNTISPRRRRRLSGANMNWTNWQNCWICLESA